MLTSKMINHFDKLSYYEKAASDSLQLQQLMKNDPYYIHADTATLQGMGTSLKGVKHGNNLGSRRSSTIDLNSTYADANETKVYQKLAQLDSALNTASISESEKHLESKLLNFLVILFR